MLKYGSQEARELTNLSTTDVFKFLEASNVSTSEGTVKTSMKSKIDIYSLMELLSNLSCLEVLSTTTSFSLQTK